MFADDYNRESDILKTEFNFIRIGCFGSASLYVILDMNVSEFPHNLFLDLDGNFIYHKRPIANIISTEWYLSNSSRTKLTRDFTKSIWIPTEGGDLAISILFQNLEGTLTTERFHIEQTLAIKSPISSEMNILVSHGTNEIAINQAIYPNESPKLNVSPILGTGKILILFVCHSGSIRSTPFENSVSTLVKKFLSEGYVSIIAPFWSLHIDIPPIWLPKLLEELNKGESLAHAVHQANLVVFDSFPTIAAWACLHLYGDPHITLETN
ncbi:hypothetical protein [Dyadobacter luteus]|nr:hypothetical protein [Dyadobacter luteus]